MLRNSWSAAEVPGEVAQPAQIAQVVVDPRIANALRNELAEFRIGMQHPTAWRDTVGFVEALGVELVELGHQVGFDEFGVKLGHAVDAKGTDRRQVGHAHLLLRALLDDRQSCQPVRVARPTDLHLSRKRRLIS